MKRKLKKGWSKGFTLLETIITVAVVVVLFGVAGLAAAETQWALKQTEVDAIAREMYVVAQQNLTQATVSHNTDAIAAGAEGVQLITDKPEDYTMVEGSSYATTQNLYNVRTPLLSGGDIVGEQARKILFPEGSTDAAYLANEWIVEYDPATGIVVSVFYADKLASSDTNAFSFYTNSIINGDKDGLRVKRANRIKFAKQDNGYLIGYYGGSEIFQKANNKVKEATSSATLAMKVENNDKLIVNYTITPPTDGYLMGTDYMVLNLDFSGEMSKEKINTQIYIKKVGEEYQLFVKKNGNLVGASEEPFLSMFEAKEDGKGNIIVSQTIEDFSSGDPSLYKHFATNFPKFTPGENVNIKAYTYVADSTAKDDLSTSSDSVKDRFNSLFSNSTYKKDDKLCIDVNYPRHLQNLNNTNLPIEKVTQSDNITFPNNFNFKPINNNNIKLYDGNGNQIQNLNAGTDNNGNSGLFGNTASGLEIKNLKLVNSKAGLQSHSIHAGTLIATAGDNVKITYCSIYQTVNYKGTNTAPTALVRAIDDDKSDGDRACAGGIIGYAGVNLSITNSFAATVVESDYYAGGLVGYANSGADVDYSYADCYLNGVQDGGLIGDAKASTYKNCYAAGMTYFKSGETNSSKQVYVYGLAGNTITSAIYAYTVFDNTAAQNAYTTFGGVTGTNTKVRYLETLSGTNTSGTTAISHDDLIKDEYSYICNILGDGSGSKFVILTGKSHPYNYNNLDLTNYPYPTLNGLEHYGDWTDIYVDPSAVGFFYWEYEAGGEHQGYNYYMINLDGKVVMNTLCKNHDDGGDITSYGYGYAIRKDYASKTSVVWDSTSVSTKKSSKFPYYTVNATENTLVSSNVAKAKELQGNYNVTCYTTMSSSKDGDEVLSRGDADDFFLINDKTYTPIQFVVSMKTFEYNFCPYFAADIVKGVFLNYYNTYNTVLETPKAHQVRSIEQLQYLNWNWYTRNCQTKSTALQHYVSKGALVYSLYPFLNSKTVTRASSFINFDTSIYRQTHDFDATGYSNYTPIAALGSLALDAKYVDYSHEVSLSHVQSMLYIYNWFGCEYDGQTYQIKNLNISSDAYTVGLFGTTVGARLKNIVMTSDTPEDEQPQIVKKEGSVEGAITGTEYSKYTSDYYVGGIVGLCAQSTLRTGTLKNCAIGGYDIIDNTAHNTTYNGAAVGGLVGSSGVRISNCEAVVDIKMNCTSNYGVTTVGGLVGTINSDGNSITQGILKNPAVSHCYTGGTISFADSTRKKVAGSNLFRGYYVGGVVGSNRSLSIANIEDFEDDLKNVIFDTVPWSNSIAIYDCYTYMSLPEKDETDNIYSIGVIFASSETPLSRVGYTPFSGRNYIVDCYYLKDNIKETLYNNFVEYEWNLGELSFDNLMGTVVSIYDDEVSVDFGVRGMSFEEMKALNNGNVALVTYNCIPGIDEPYPLKTVVTRGKETTLHAGEWMGYAFDGTIVKLSKGRATGANSKTYTYLAKTGALVENMQSQNLAQWEGYDLQGYYYDLTGAKELIVDKEGQFQNSQRFFTDGAWSYGESKLTLEADWTPTTYKITYDYSNGVLEGGKTNREEYTIETEDFTLNNPTRKGYEFVGWTGTELDDPVKNVTVKNGSLGDREYTANWKITEYKITYKLQGGNLASGVTNPDKYTVETESFTLNNPTKTGYTFIGWSVGEPSDVNNTTVPRAIEYNIAKGTTGDIVLYANWGTDVYTITYETSNISIPVQEGLNPSTYTVATPTFTLKNPDNKTGYTFLGWSEKRADGTYGQPSKSVQITVGSTGNRVYRAEWQIDTYTITLNLNGGTVNSQTGTYTMTYTVLDSVSLPAATKTHYQFKGWSTNANGSSPTLNLQIPVGTTGNKTYYAVWWAPSVNLVSKYLPGANGSTITVVAEYDANTKVMINVPTATRAYDGSRNWTLDGWYNGTTKYFNADGSPVSAKKSSITNGMTLKPKWTLTATGVYTEVKTSGTLTDGATYAIVSAGSLNGEYYCMNKETSESSGRYKLKGSTLGKAVDTDDNGKFFIGNPTATWRCVGSNLVYSQDTSLYLFYHDLYGGYVRSGGDTNYRVRNAYYNASSGSLTGKVGKDGLFTSEYTVAAKQETASQKYNLTLQHSTSGDSVVLYKYNAGTVTFVDYE